MRARAAAPAAAVIAVVSGGGNAACPPPPASTATTTKSYAAVPTTTTSPNATTSQQPEQEPGATHVRTAMGRGDPPVSPVDTPPINGFPPAGEPTQPSFPADPKANPGDSSVMAEEELGGGALVDDELGGF